MFRYIIEMTEWTDFVKKYAKTNNLTYGKAILPASKEWKKSKGSKDADNISRLRSNEMTKDFTTKKGDKLRTGKNKGKQAYSKEK
tara:strand:- start:984 stop:1238 length:255 start_codon:yes stop_codon:yes gene_type:complete